MPLRFSCVWSKSNDAARRSKEVAHKAPIHQGGSGMTDNEKKLVIALVRMVDQYLDRYGDEVDSSMSAGEQAIEVLAGFGLMEAVNTRFGRWTEAGDKFWKRSACDVLSRWIIRPDSFGREVRAEEMIADAANHPRYCGFN